MSQKLVKLIHRSGEKRGMNKRQIRKFRKSYQEANWKTKTLLHTELKKET